MTISEALNPPIPLREAIERPRWPPPTQTDSPANVDQPRFLVRRDYCPAALAVRFQTSRQQAYSVVLYRDRQRISIGSRLSLITFPRRVSVLEGMLERVFHERLHDQIRGTSYVWHGTGTRILPPRFDWRIGCFEFRSNRARAGTLRQAAPRLSASGNKLIVISCPTSGPFRPLVRVAALANHVKIEKAVV